MSQEFVLDAEPRSDKGKGASRRLRRENKVPGIIYGGGVEPLNIALDHNQVAHRLENEAFYSHVLTVKVGGNTHEAILRDVQRHPARPVIMHMDFQRISKDKPIHVHVPLHFVNEDKCEGVKLGGGIISKILVEVEVSCLPQNLPEYIEVDLLNLQVGESIHLSELKLPEGISLVALSHGSIADHDTAVVSVHKPRGALEEEEAAASAEGTPAAGEGQPPQA
jgi:large subunit ribosomal protein L25